MNVDKQVLLIEDNEEEAEEYMQLLQRAGGFEVVYIPVRPVVADYADLLSDTRTGAILIDQRLDDYGGVAYDGIDVAGFLRALRPELPLYILTKYANDDLLKDQEEVVDSIIDKRTVHDRANVHASRILRSINRYEAALSDKRARLKYLIERRIVGELNPQEEEELQVLRADYERPFGLRMLQQEEAWRVQLEKEEEHLARLERAVRDIRAAAAEQKEGNQGGSAASASA